MSPDHQDQQSQLPRIRPVDVSHIGELIRIAADANLSPWTALSYLDELKNQDSVMLRMVGDDNSVIGFIVGRFVPGGDTDVCRDAEIYNIAVVEASRRCGFAQRLLDEFVSRCAKREVVNIWLEVRESNLPAIRFYERNGFAQVQTRNHFYDSPREHAILMKLHLKKAEA